MSSFSERKLVAPIPFPFLFEWIIMEAKSESPKSLLNQMGCCLKRPGKRKENSPFLLYCSPRWFVLPAAVVGWDDPPPTMGMGHGRMHPKLHASQNL
jgi:hypothetical protein